MGGMGSCPNLKKLTGLSVNEPDRRPVSGVSRVGFRHLVGGQALITPNGLHLSRLIIKIIPGLLIDRNTFYQVFYETVLSNLMSNFY